MIYLNDNESYVAAWLHNLARENLLGNNVKIDDRSIAEVSADDVRGSTQAHFFAGIGGWPLALQLAGWPADGPVWTGSPPCQPFSSAGKRAGAADERHLWPEMRRLIEDCRPPVVFGEQVASDDGRRWLSRVRDDLEGVGYGVGAADLCAAGVGAPHVRQRLYWGAIRLDNPQRPRLAEREQQCEFRGGAVRGYPREEPVVSGDPGWLADADDDGCDQGGEGLAPARDDGAVGDGSAGDWNGSATRWHLCRDLPQHKWRRIPAEPELFPLAHGVPGRVGQLRAYGNAIVPQVAALFIRHFMAAVEDTCRD